PHLCPRSRIGVQVFSDNKYQSGHGGKRQDRAVATSVDHSLPTSTKKRISLLTSQRGQRACASLFSPEHQEAGVTRAVLCDCRLLPCPKRSGGLSRWHRQFRSRIPHRRDHPNRRRKEGRTREASM